MNSTNLQATISELSALLSYADSTARHANEILDGTNAHYGRLALAASAQIKDLMQILIRELQVDLNIVLQQEAATEHENRFR